MGKYIPLIRREGAYGVTSNFILLAWKIWGAFMKKLFVKQILGPILIISPHPDDDILAAGGLIQRAQQIGTQIYVLFLTSGDANTESVTRYLHERPSFSSYQELGYLRFGEAVRAETYLGVPRSHLYFLGLPDGILLDIASDLNQARVHQSPFTGLTKSTYSFSFEPNLPYTHQAALQAVEKVLSDVKPESIVLNLKYDTHPDHRAARILLLEAAHALGIRPYLYRYLIHYPYWPVGQQGTLYPPKGLYVPGLRTLPLTLTEMKKTLIAYKFHRSQELGIPTNFNLIRTNELFWEARTR